MQTPRLSTKARDEVEALSALLHHIAHDGVFSEAEWAACERQMGVVLDLVAKTDDALGIGMAALKGGVTRHVRDMVRSYDDTHGTVIQMPVHIQERRRHGSDDSAA